MQRLRSIVYGEIGQTTAEYALVLLAAGLVVGAFTGFVKSGALNEVFDRIVQGLVDQARG